MLDGVNDMVFTYLWLYPFVIKSFLWIVVNPFSYKSSTPFSMTTTAREGEKGPGYGKLP
jgi:hypothetical protein